MFKELLEESLESGQKVVIYSQFLKMIQIMEKHLAQEAIDFVSLTGKTVNREKVIQRFNQDPHCRVFVGEPQGRRRGHRSGGGFGGDPL